MRAGPLIVGLGNPFHGDAGVGLRILEMLATDPRLPEDVEMMSATPEFARQRDYLKGRGLVIFLDAFSRDEPGEVIVLEDAALRALDPAVVGTGRPLSARHALDLLEQATSKLMDATFRVVGVAIGTGAPAVQPGLSEAVEAGARVAADRVLELLAEQGGGEPEVGEPAR